MDRKFTRNINRFVFASIVFAAFVAGAPCFANTLATASNPRSPLVVGQGIAPASTAPVAAAMQPTVQNAYNLTYLDSDGAVPAANPPDADLVNAWGIASSGTGPWWVADNGTSLSTLYNGAGVKQGLVVTVADAPTGIVFNGGAEFVVTGGSGSGPAVFMFATEDGTILGWNPKANPTVAQVGVPNTTGAVYKGLAIAETSDGGRIYATDFHNGRVNMFDGSFQPVTIDGAFQDSKIPPGFAPFGIRNIEGRIFVTFAKQDADRHDDVQGPSLGYVDVFDLDGSLIARAAIRGLLNSPWGLARAPSDWGKFSGDLLVGNFGDGRITAFHMSDDMTHFSQKGQLMDTNHKPIVISGLWGIAFGNGGSAGPVDALFFAAGTNHEADGAFGNITVAE